MEFSQIDVPVFGLTRKETHSQWDVKRERILQKFKGKLTSAPILIISHPT